MQPPPEPQYEAVPFVALTRLLDSLSQVGAKAGVRQKYMTRFFEHYGNGHYWPVYRLFMPKFDHERTAYGLKEKTIAKAYVELLAIDPHAEDAQRLLKFQVPTSENRRAGDFAEAVRLALRGRAPANADKLTIGQVNDYLDRLARAPDMASKKVVLGDLLRITTPEMQKWLIRIILKDHKLGASEKFFLHFLHPDAEQLQNQCSRLKRVCEELTDRSKRVVDSMLRLMEPVKPMLAGQTDWEKLQFDERHYVWEVKYDGHRIQVHRSGDRFAFFSRAGHNHEKDYGHVLTPLLRECVACDNYILDGELMTWYDHGGPNGGGRFGKFKEVRTMGIGARRRAAGLVAPVVEEDGDVDEDGEPLARPAQGGRLVYIVFDVLMVNKESLLNKSLRHRDQILRDIVKPKETHLELVQRRVLTSMADLDKAIDQAMNNKDEGIMIKNLDESYVPGERKWIKVKPDYMGGIGDSLDLVIVGAWYGEGTSYRTGSPSHFLLACPAPVREGGRVGERWYTVGKVGTGYTALELADLQYRLQKYWRSWDKKEAARIIEMTPTAEVPHVYLDPLCHKDAAVVLEIKVASLEPSPKYRLGYTVRHPRVERIRTDKGIDDATSFAMLLDMCERGGGQWAQRTQAEARAAGLAGFGRAQRAAKKPKTAKTRMTDLQLASAQATAFDARGVEAISTMWQGWTFHVRISDSVRKQAWELTLVQNGAQCVPFPNRDTTDCIIAEDPSNVRVAAWIQADLCDIVKPAWLEACLQAKRVVTLEPRWMIHTTSSTRDEMLEEMDHFGDYFTRHVSPDAVKDIFSYMDTVPDADFSQVDTAEALEEASFREERPFFCMFKGMLFYVDVYAHLNNPASRISASSLEVTCKLIEHYQGSISPTITKHVTHIVMHRAVQQRYVALKAEAARVGGKEKMIVSSDWVHVSVRKHESLSEAGFRMEVIRRRERQLRKKADPPKRRAASLAASHSGGGSAPLINE